MERLEKKTDPLDIDTEEQARLAALRRYDILDTPPEEAFDCLVDLATTVFDVPIALVSLVDEERQWFKACYGLDVRETSRDVSFCAHAIVSDKVMVIPDATQDPRFCENPLVTGVPGIRFYAGAPLRTPDGHNLGSLCVIDTQPRHDFKAKQRQVLAGLAAQVVGELELRLTAERLRRERDLTRQLEAELSNFFALSLDLFCIAGADGVFTHANPAWERALGFSVEELAAQPFLAFVHPDDREATERAMERLRDESSLEGFENRYSTKAGDYRWLRWSAQADRAAHRGYAVARDVTERKRAEAELQRVSQERINILESISDIFFSLDPEWHFTYINTQAESFLGRPRDMLLQNNVWEAFPEITEYLFYEKCHEAAASRRQVTFEEYYPPDNRWFEVHLYPASDGLSVYLADVSDRKQHEAAQREMNRELERRVEARTAELAALNAQLQHDAFHDALTGLANRALLLDRLAQAIRRRSDKGYAVLFLDFDRFKLVNDSLGHDAGDALLVALGGRLEGCVRPSDTVARLGGDEFVLLLENVTSHEATLRTVERIQNEVAKPFEFAGHTLHTSVSIGIVSSETGHDSAEAVLRDADLAMYRAKALGKARYQVFTQEMRERAVSLMSLENDLRGAVEREELRVFYQPIISVADEHVTGFEALVRWEHPEHGLVSPAEFIPIAEDTGLIIDLDRWVLKEACRQVKAWQAGFADGSSLTVSVNLSGQQFGDPGLAGYVGEVLIETGVDPSLLKLEITESTLMQQADLTVATLQQLKALGVQIYIDDFGTGYSSLSYLQRFPANTLKIDRAFVNQMLHSPESNALIATIIAMAENLKLTVVAEGIETQEQLERLRALGCQYGQGYLIAKPLRAAEVPAYLRPSKQVRK